MHGAPSAPTLQPIERTTIAGKLTDLPFFVTTLAILQPDWMQCVWVLPLPKGTVLHGSLLAAVTITIPAPICELILTALFRTELVQREMPMARGALLLHGYTVTYRPATVP